MNKRFATFLEKINFAKIVKDIIWTYIISICFAAIYHLSFESELTIVRNVFADDIWRINSVLIIFRIFFEIYMAVFSENHDGWLINKNVIYRHSGPSESLLYAVSTSNKEIADFNNKVNGIHEAGHAIMAAIFAIEHFTVKTSYTKSYVSMQVEKLLDAEGLHKHILIDYSGAIAEEIILGFISSGCMGTDSSDFEQATKRIKEYLIITDSTWSKTGLDDGINNQITELSKKFYDEAKDILIYHKEKIEKLATSLCNHKSLSQDDVKKILEL